jgi:hypothetical protein
MIKEEALKNNYGDVTADNFGATVVQLPVRNLSYSYFV